MAAILSSNAVEAASLSACPFCSKLFRGVGNHLPRCKERNGADYSCYLSQKKRLTSALVRLPDRNALGVANLTLAWTLIFAVVLPVETFHIRLLLFLGLHLTQSLALALRSSDAQQGSPTMPISYIYTNTRGQSQCSIYSKCYPMSTAQGSFDAS